MQAEMLPLPHLDARLFGARRLSVLTDEALFARTGIRIAFTGRAGGVSESPFSALNLGGHVGDDAEAVATNRSLLLEAMGAPDVPLIMANQVHGNHVVEVVASDVTSIETARVQALAGADALLVDVPQVGALLCFADCVPVIVVSPTGRFVVAHAGWRGAVAGIASRAVRRLVARDTYSGSVEAAASYNAYLGPHIHAECFETGSDVRARFVERFGKAVAPDDKHVDLTHAVALDLESAGLQAQRVVDAGVCTACQPDEYFSYRASGGTCGRHGAFAVLQKG
ncbi:MAG: polyphenol oxidase family protein [Gordonibacter sp.]|nr:polyphenol oxidase family protein [Gordonibacter sp.]